MYIISRDAEGRLHLIFPVKSFKRFDNPYYEKGEPAKYQCYVNAKDMPEELGAWLNVNPREQNLNTAVSKAIKNSLLDEDLDFHLLNRGILISVESVSYDNKTGKIDIELTDFEKHGIIDGGHTFKVICENKEFIDTEKYVNLEIIENFGVVENLAEARNTSVAVDSKSIEELRGTFDCIKGIIKDHKIGQDLYSNRIAFKQNSYLHLGENPIDIREIVAIINMFNPYMYDPLKATHPIQSYSGKEVSLKKFLNIAGTNESENKKETMRNSIIISMSQIIKDCFELWDKIELEFSDVSKDLKKKYGSKKYSNFNNDKITKVSLFSNKNIDYTIPRGILYPCLGAFRALIDFNKDTKEIKWKMNPFIVWNEKKKEIVSLVLENSKSVAGDNPEILGKSQLIWDSLYNLILIHRLMENHS